MDLTFIIMLVIMGVVFVALNTFTKRSNQKRVDERDRMLREDLVPGAWVHTSVGFFGRFVDIDGDVIILETPGGVETYWNKAVVRAVGDLPFEVEEDAAELENVEDVDVDFPSELDHRTDASDQSTLDDNPDQKA